MYILLLLMSLPLSVIREAFVGELAVIELLEGFGHGKPVGEIMVTFG